MTVLNPSSDATVSTLADARLPERVRAVLEAVLRVASDELERRLDGMLVEFEQQLFRLADHARNPAIESGYLQTLRNMRLNRADLIPRFMLGVEANLARVGRDAQPAAAAAPVQGTGFDNLALVDHTEIDAELLLRDIAQRSEARASLPLHLLGQRFGVLAAAPAFDAERLPLGPQSLCMALQEASEPLQLPQDSQQLLLRTFERKVMADYAELAELLNATLASEGILPALTYVPLRLRPTRTDANAGGASDAAPAGVDGKGDARKRSRPHTAWNAPDDDTGADAMGAFGMLQELLAGRGGPGRATHRTAPKDRNPGTSAAELVALLAQLRAVPAAGTGTAGGIGELKQDLLARMRSQHGADASLSREDNDTFDLLGMFYERIEREVRVDTLASALLKRLQVPVLQAALLDHGFFVRPQHPARQLLNTVAESGARWLDEGDSDPSIMAPLKRAVEHVVAHAHEGPAAFEASNRKLQRELQLQARRSEMAERRHVEAARGKEKLEIAKRMAAETITTEIGARQPHKFVRALIEQAWADVLALSLLRHSPESDEWQGMLDTTRRIVAACCGDEPVPDPELAGQVEAALAQVGYHGDEAAAISRRLTSVREEGDGASRTELAATLKARARLGEGSQKPKAEARPRNAEEQAQYERVRTLPYGTWIEFVTNQQGDVVRKRLSWYSPVTDHALFVNMRGQRIGEQTLDSVARMLARGQARVVTVDRARLVDRAWQATLGTLRGLARRNPRNGTGARS